MLTIMEPADIIARARAAGITLRQVFAEAGIASTMFERWNRGTSVPSLATAVALTEATEKLTRPAPGRAANRNPRKEIPTHG